MYQHTVNGFRSIDSKMLNTARTMGASETKIFLKLVLPLSKRSILAGIYDDFAKGIWCYFDGCLYPRQNKYIAFRNLFLVEQGKEMKHGYGCLY